METKKQIENAISEFADLRESSLNLFKILGYESTRTTTISIDKFKNSKDFNSQKGIIEDWKNVELLFQLTDSEVNQNLNQTNLFDSSKEVDEKEMKSYIFLAIELEGEKYTRTQISQATREINKVFPMPVLVLFRFSNEISIAIINRRFNKNDREKKVLQKVTLIKNISISNPHRAHVEILFDLSFEQLTKKKLIKSNNFVGLHKAWEQVLDINELNKNFYKEISNWYFWALHNVEFPDDAEKNKEIREPQNLIRLLTRLIFVWFLKEKDLIPEKLFDKEEIEKILISLEENETSYYKVILQNLFFPTLNVPIKKRKFRFEKSFQGKNKDYKNPLKYRYKKLLKNEESFENLFSNIPFLNGGLFECLDKKKEKILIDCFSENSRNEARLKVPNKLFFLVKPKDITIINNDLGTKGKTYKVRGLLEILKRYKFTVTENTPVEEEIALDPELLGRVFENLLASYNPETKTTARKQTGSFYTPREIVNYMVDESLVAFLSTKLAEKIENCKKNIPEKLRKTLSYTEKDHPFQPNEVDALISAINECKILDPACGSGAFPMGILHKLVYLLSKLDPENERWKAIQKKEAVSQFEKAIEQTDPKDRKKRIDEIDELFELNSSDYGRKLFLIENCIYGVDIQPIAIQISKLRFFISLIVDQKKNTEKENFGILPLPNLETKLVSANTLIGIDELKNQIELFDDLKIKNFKSELKKNRKEYFKSKSREDKKRLKKEDLEIRENLGLHLKGLIDNEINSKINREIKLTELEYVEDRIKFYKNEPEKQKKFIKIKENFDSQILKIKNSFNSELYQNAINLARWNIYDNNSTANFFDSDWMFGITKGFDIVIGNPPYVQLQKAINGKQKLADLYKNFAYKTFERTGDIYSLFYENGIENLVKNGTLSFITSNKWLRANYGKSLRKFFSEKNPLKLIDLGPGVFNSATVDTNILLIKNSPKTKDSKLKALTFTKENKIEKLQDSDFTEVKNLDEESWLVLSPIEQKIKEKIEKVGTPLKNWDVNIYRGVLTGFNEAFIIDGKTKEKLISQDPKSAEIIKPILRGRDIKRYRAEFADLWLISTFPALKINIENYPVVENYLKGFLPKINQTGESFVNDLGQIEKTRKKTGNKWFETQDQIAYYKEFEKEKIVWAETIKIYFYGNRNFPRFTFLESIQLDKTCFMLISKSKDEKYILSILNSKVFEFYILNLVMTLGGGSLGIQKTYVNQIPIPKISELEQEPFIKLVDEILAKKEANPNADTSNLEQEIDILVYKLYDLTYEEVKIIDPTFPLSAEEFGE